VVTIRASPSDHGEELCWLDFFLENNGSGPDLQTDESESVETRYPSVWRSGPEPFFSF